MLHKDDDGANPSKPIRTDLHATLAEAVDTALRVDMNRGRKADAARATADHDSAAAHHPGDELQHAAPSRA